MPEQSNPAVSRKSRTLLIVLLALIAFLMLGGALTAGLLYYQYEPNDAIPLADAAAFTTSVTPPLPEATADPAPAAVQPPAAPEPPNSVLDQLKGNLLAHLPFNNSLEDVSAQLHPVAISGRVEATTLGALFHGDGILALPHIPLDNQPFAIAMWILPEGNIDSVGLLQQIDVEQTNHHLHLMLREPDQPRLGFYVNDLPEAERHITADAGWSHLVFQYTGWKQEIWLNGELVGERQTVAYKGNTGPTLIGKAPNWHGNPPTQNFKGWMRDFRIYSAALNAQQVKALANQKPAPPPTPPPDPIRPPGNDQF